MRFSTQEEWESACRRSSSGASANSSASQAVRSVIGSSAAPPYRGRTRAQTKSTASPTVSISAASSSLTRIAVAVLELHHQLVEVERVGVQVLAEPRLGLDLLGIDLELGRPGGPGRASSPRLVPCRPLSLHRSAEVRSREATRASRPSAQRSAVRSTARSCTARSARRTAFAIPSGVELPWATTATPRRPEQHRPADGVGSMPRGAGPRGPGAAAGRRPPRSGPSARRRGRRPRPPSRCPPSVFSVTLPVKPSVTTTSATPVSRSRPSTLPMKSDARRPSAERLVGLDHVGVALLLLLAHARAAPTRGRSTPSTASAEGRAQVGELDQVLGPHLGVGAARRGRASSSLTPGHSGPARRAPGGARP